MKRIFTLLVALAASVSSQAEIIYVNGPSFPVPYLGSRGVDIDGDGTEEFVVWSGGMLCTDDIPSSGCGWPFYLGSTNQLLMSGYTLAPRILGSVIENNPPTGSEWNIPSPYGAGLAFWWSSLYGRDIEGQLVHEGWSGGVGDVGVGYLGVRFNRADGWHYGWVRVRLPQSMIFAGGLPSEVIPSVVDWAYESRTNTPIRAGAIGPGGDAILFTVKFFESGPQHRRAGSGTFILANGILRGELSLDGKFSSADIRRAKNPHSQSKPLWSFDPPLVSSTNHTAFFGEVNLTRSDLLALSNGLLHVSLDDGEIVGRIVPTENRAVIGR